MISKELMSEVLGIEFPVEEYIKIEKGSVIYKEKVGFFQNDVTTREINLHELAHKCKEWAMKKTKFEIYSVIYNDTEQGCVIGNPALNEHFIADTEPQAIFKACQWILDND